jgi:type I restriction enzyme, S subunit
MKHETTVYGEVPFYKIGTFGKHANAFISLNLYESYKKKYPFPNKGDILISAAGTIGRIVIYDGQPAYFQDSNIVWIENNESLIRNTFLSFCYENVKWNTENTTIARLYNDNLRKICINIPSLPEQQKIADLLTMIDKKITQVDQKIEKVTEFKKGLLQQMFV